ncbi:endonuclease/exonuclease/phosphatase family protein [Rhodococcus sp. IEGM 1381]|uniref:endonuclease/exonuclease/phosphatase family protein n=1 Tax=Rhodococcus sp. IEGM 1381 TaxID=3047085 RepID=UPI0024B69529|nr:endonuclease/exonuclease/phosphatase family protein [Rhodococcus sp. IEGM 1381]MDI9896617.1 endonuclease/exonuclease/phosphatase family protein [Rhodococcus sp. IEGM 1381]
MPRLVAVAVTLAFMAAGCSSADTATDAPSSIRVATFNASLNRPALGQLVSDLQSENAQARAAADVISANSPDVLLINEFDYSGDAAVTLFNDNYLDKQYPYSFTAPVNTGVDSELDLDKDGALGGPGDAWGFGQFPGQYGMVVFSKFPIDTESVRTFQNFLWKDMPDSLLPRDYYGEVSDALRLSSKSHWDVPIDVNGKTLHVLASHPTPPSFDGPEDRNGKRNHDEIRLSADYISGADYLYDDKGVRGGLEQGASFVMLGDQNSDPVDGDSVAGAIAQVLDLPRVQDPAPTSGEHGTDTADFADPTPGDLRVDYVLPSDDLTVVDSQVYWPNQAEHPSDHRLVWADLEI